MAPRHPATVAPPRVGLALAGGGPLGAIYEIGALTALSEAIDGVDFNAASVYVGVSAGGFIAAGLANGITPLAMCRLFIESEDGRVNANADAPFDPAMLLKPAFDEYGERIARIPPLVADALWHYAVRGGTLTGAFQRLAQAIPSGVFSNAGVERYLVKLFAANGRSNDFRQLRRKLFLIATDLDSGQAVEFGSPGHDHVPISTAVRASAALPGLFPPVRIDGHDYVDGALRHTLHASVALRQGIDLLFCLNPLVPYDASVAARSAKRHAHAPSHLVQGGLPIVLAQTMRAVIHSRMEVGMSRYARLYPDSDIVLFEPNRADADMFFTNMFSYASRRRLCEHAYQKTRQELWNRRDEIGPALARHGMRINLGVLSDTRLHLVKPAAQRDSAARTATAKTVRRLRHTLDDLDRALAIARARED